MVTVIKTCDNCGKIIKDDELSVHVWMKIEIDEIDENPYCKDDHKISVDFHPKCFRQCFNTFIDSDNQCFFDLNMKEGEYKMIAWVIVIVVAVILGLSQQLIDDEERDEYDEEI